MEDHDGPGLGEVLLGVLLVAGLLSGTAGATSSTRHGTAVAAASVPAPPPAPNSAKCGRAFVASIVTQESHGNYRARSPAGALGRYQVMPDNVGPWSREILGHPVSVQEFLDSPALQDRIAVGKLDRYCAAYGRAGAAAAWYSGDPGRAGDCSPVAGGPAVCEYVRQVLARIP